MVILLYVRELKSRSRDIKSNLSPKDHFTLSELAENLLENNSVKKEEVLTLRDWLYQGEEFFYNQGSFYRKASFFRDSYFYIQLTEKEWESGFLIPGHRWHPFVSRSLNPWDITLLDMDGNIVEQEERLVDWGSLKPFHLLLGEEQLFSDCQMKSDLFGRFFAQFPQYDLRDMLENIDPTEKTYLKCQVLDYEKGIIRITSFESGAKKEEQEQWVSLLEQALVKVFDNKKLSLTLPEQVEWALFYGDPLLRQKPTQTLASAIYNNPKLALYRIGLTTLLWKSDGSIETILQGNELLYDPGKLKKESLFIIREMEVLFNDLSPFTIEALGPLKELSLGYMEHFTRCIDAMCQGSVKPMEKEAQLFFTISQYSHCLLDFFREMVQSPPSGQEKETLSEMLIETEDLLSRIEPFLFECKTPRF